ncbi:MAG: T9SS type A sorting domain-containing protein [Saprospiraceae bacterium]
MIRIIFILLFVLQSGLIFSQNWAPLGAKWTYRKDGGIGGGSSYYYYTAEKDTIIKNQNCIKIAKKGDVYCYQRPKAEFTFSRNDSVYFYNPKLDTFQLLYDFKAKPGSSWGMDFYDEFIKTEVFVEISIKSVGTRLINNQLLKTQEVVYNIDRGLKGRSSYNSTIIEKLGDQRIMVNFRPSVLGLCDVDGAGWLTCYYDKSIGNYPFQTADSCTYFWIATKDLHSLDNLIYPNPAFDHIYIPEEFQSSYYHFYDCTGRVVSEGIISESGISIVNLKEGLYFLSIFDVNGEKLISKRITKI